MKRTKLLTPKEEDIMNLIIKGKTNKEIGEILYISIHTVKAHIENIYRKLDVHNKVQATIKFIKLNKNF